MLHEALHPEGQGLVARRTIALLVVFLTRVSRWLLPWCPCNTFVLDTTPNVQSPLGRYQTMVEYRAGCRPLTAGSAASSPSEDAGRWHCLRGWDQRAKLAKLQHDHLTRDGNVSEQDESEGFSRFHMKIACVVIRPTFLWNPPQNLMPQISSNAIMPLPRAGTIC